MFYISLICIEKHITHINFFEPQIQKDDIHTNNYPTKGFINKDDVMDLSKESFLVFEETTEIN